MRLLFLSPTFISLDTVYLGKNEMERKGGLLCVPGMVMFSKKQREAFFFEFVG